MKTFSEYIKEDLTGQEFTWPKVSKHNLEKFISDTYDVLEHKKKSLEEDKNEHLRAEIEQYFQNNGFEHFDVLVDHYIHHKRKKHVTFSCKFEIQDQMYELINFSDDTDIVNLYAIFANDDYNYVTSYYMDDMRNFFSDYAKQTKGENVFESRGTIYISSYNMFYSIMNNHSKNPTMILFSPKKYYENKNATLDILGTTGFVYSVTLEESESYGLHFTFDNSKSSKEFQSELERMGFTCEYDKNDNSVLVSKYKRKN